MKVITASLAGVFAIPAFAQTPAATTPAPPCNGAEYRSLDFWVGEWIAEDQNGQPIGTNRITRDEYGNCVITEHFRMNDGTLIGHSVSIYRPGLKQWCRTGSITREAISISSAGPSAGTITRSFLRTSVSPKHRLIKG